MTKLSIKKLSEDKMGLLIEQLWRAFASLKDKDEVHAFLHDILTHTEIQMLAKRLQVVMMLEEGLTYEQIKDVLNISEATISKIANWKQAFGSGYQIVIERLSDQKRNPRLARGVTSSRRAAWKAWS
ncbi:MAG: helix-turn-helix domain-containing protein [Candidatus Doudnabacteria bacterium]|nr:helix-turn-helix domain-containing protein [Candidatus Doudnabacteria bacterium]